MRTGRPLKRVDAYEVGALRQRGFSFNKIAEILGVSRNTIVKRRQLNAEFKRLTDRPRHIPLIRTGDKMVLVPLTKREYQTLRARAATETSRDFTEWARRRLLTPTLNEIARATETKQIG